MEAKSLVNLRRKSRVLMILAKDIKKERMSVGEIKITREMLDRYRKLKQEI